MSAQHSKGRISVKGTRLYADDYPGIDCIATMQVSNQPMWDEDARRLVACWNACEGISTGALESEQGTPLIVSFQQAQDRADLAERQRDELLDSIKNYLEVYEKHGKKPGWVDRIHDARARCMEAIAKATGGAA